MDGILESFKRDNLTYFEVLLSFKSEKQRIGYVNRLYKSYFNKDGSVNVIRVKSDRDKIKGFIGDCKEIKEHDYVLQRFSLILQVI